MQRSRIADYLEGATGGGTSANGVATLVVSTLRGIDKALAPIVGQRGTAALYKRSLHLARPRHPWLPADEQASESEIDVVALTAALAAQSVEEAVSGGTLLLENHAALLTTLIGESLTERLLRPVWSTLLSGPSALDNKS